MTDHIRFNWTKVTFQGYCSGCGSELEEEWVTKLSPCPKDRWVRCGRTYGCGTVTLLVKTETEPADVRREGIAPPRENEEEKVEAEA